MIDYEHTKAIISDDPSSDDSSDEDKKVPCWGRIWDEVEYSDWQIDVTITSDNCDEKASYLVHRYRIGLKSEYFHSVFLDKTRCFSSFEFPADTPVTLRYFEKLLDYFYLDDCSKGETAWSENESLAMLYLADYFGINKLRKRLLVFIRSRISNKISSCTVDWLAKLYSLADKLSIEEFQVTIAKTCHDHHAVFGCVWKAMQTSDVKRKLLYRMCTFRKKSPEKNEKWHQCVTLIFQSNPEIIDDDLFSELTNKEVLGGLNGFDESIKYLQHEHRLRLDESELDKLTCLQQKCIDSVYDSKNRRWKFWNSTPNEIMKILRQLKPAITESLLLRTMEQKRETRKRKPLPQKDEMIEKELFERRKRPCLC